MTGLNRKRSPETAGRPLSYRTRDCERCFDVFKARNQEQAAASEGSELGRLGQRLRLLQLSLRLNGCDLLQQGCDRRGGPPFVVENRLPCPVAELRQKAAEALGLLGDRRAILTLSGLLQDPDYRVRESAAFALTRFADFPVSPELVTALRDTDTTVQLHASRALLQCHDPKAIDALIAAMPNPNAIYTLGESHDSRAIPALIKLLQNPANQTSARAAAAASLGTSGDLRAVEPLIASLAEDNAAVAQQASLALGALKDKRAIAPLRQAQARWSGGQRENADSVRNFFVQALLELGVTDVVQGATGIPVH